MMNGGVCLAAETTVTTQIGKLFTVRWQRGKVHDKDFNTLYSRFIIISCIEEMGGKRSMQGHGINKSIADLETL
jgi:hypothetical protein